MRKIRSHGSAQDMLSAFKHQLNISNRSVDVTSATDADNARPYSNALIDMYKDMAIGSETLIPLIRWASEQDILDFMHQEGLDDWMTDVSREGLIDSYEAGEIGSETLIPLINYFSDQEIKRFLISEGMDDWMDVFQNIQSATSIKASKVSKGNVNNMIDAFESKILELEDKTVNSATAVTADSWEDALYGYSDVRAYVNGNKEFYGKEIEMDYGDGFKLAKYLKRKGENVLWNAEYETWLVPNKYHWGDCYFYPYPTSSEKDYVKWDGKQTIEESTSIEASKDDPYVATESNRESASDGIPELVDSVNRELEDLDILDSWTWEEESNSLSLVTVKGKEVNEYTIPIEDLGLTDDSLDDDTHYIVKEVTATEGESIESATRVVAGTKSVVIPNRAYNEFYADAQGAFGGTEADVYSLAEIMEMWNQDNDNDPSMEPYATFNEWWADTKQWMKPSSEPSNKEDDEMFIDTDGVLGLPGDRISMRDIKAYWEDNYDSDPSLQEYNSFEDWWADTAGWLKRVTSSEAITGEYDPIFDDEYQPESEWEKVAHKMVSDSDGFMTDYTLYKHVDEDVWICMFGDEDLYRPDRDYADAEFDSYDEAAEWFDDYEGFGDDIDASSSIQASVENPTGNEIIDSYSEAELEAIYEIAERYNTSNPVSGDWDTEYEHEFNAIKTELHYSDREVEEIMSEILGF